MDFSNHLFRCSSLGKLMVGLKEPLTQNQTEELNRLLEKRNIGKITDKQTITLGELLDKKLTKPQLSKTTIDYLKLIHKEVLFKRNKTLVAKYLDKGIQVEEKNITLYSEVTGKLFLKNKKRFNNDFFTGEPDNIQGKVRDSKSSWDFSTFPFYETSIPNSDYDCQLNGYMDLTGIDEAELIYGLIDTPVKLIDDELRRMDWKHNLFTSLGDVREDSIPLVVETVQNMIYTEKGLEEYCQQSTSVQLNWFTDFRPIPNHLRIKVFEIQKDAVKIEMMKEQVVRSREFMNNMSLEIANQFEVAI